MLAKIVKNSSCIQYINRIRSVNMKRKNREKYFLVRCTEDEHREFTKFAVSRHTTVSELMRRFLHEKMELAAKEVEAA